jgi:hypothetical protein
MCVWGGVGGKVNRSSRFCAACHFLSSSLACRIVSCCPRHSMLCYLILPALDSRTCHVPCLVANLGTGTCLNAVHPPCILSCLCSPRTHPISQIPTTATRSCLHNGPSLNPHRSRTNITSDAHHHTSPLCLTPHTNTPSETILHIPCCLPSTIHSLVIHT